MRLFFARKQQARKINSDGMDRHVDLSDLFGVHHSANLQSIQAMKSFEDFSREQSSIIVSLYRASGSQSTSLSWDSDAEELIGAFVRMLWVAEYPPSWFPDILRELADEIEIECNPEKGKLEAELELLRELNNQAKQQADETRGEER
ncbi:MAG: hypothetical protein IPN20_04250 [Haliscomenobacter sp.]|nr:hypothetical protein [Haliscomenobacter sp.]